LNCEQIVKLCFNPQINQIARGYLGNIAEMYGLNTFATIPGGDAFTHGFDRDGKCRYEIDSKIVYFDSGHLTKNGALLLVKSLESHFSDRLMQLWK
jgi:hypothetical protein